jgi:hypothetical protein
MKNEGIVAVKSDIQAVWEYNLPMNATTVSESRTEFLDICERVFACFDDFFRPTQASIHRESFSPNTSIEYPLDPDRDSSDEKSHVLKISEANGLTAADIYAAANPNQSEYSLVRRININEGEIKIRLAEGDVWADQDTHTARFTTDGIDLDAGLGTDPLQIHFYILNSSYRSAIETDRSICISVYTWTDIWFEDTQIGAVNRDRLRVLLECIHNQFPESTVRRKKSAENETVY